MKAFVHGLVIVALIAGMAMPAPVSGFSNCVQFISSAPTDQPLTGWLVGERYVTYTSTTTWAGNWNYLNFGGTFDGSSSKTTSYWEGTYQMSNGTRQVIRCDAYVAV